MSEKHQAAQPQVDPAAESLVDNTAARKRALLEKVRVLSENLVNQMGQVLNGDPDYVYIWVPNYPDTITRYQNMQAEIVGAKDSVKTNFRRSDGTHVRGDVILMRMPKELAEAWNAHRDLKALEAIPGNKQSLMDWAGQQGIPAHLKQ